MFHVKHFCKRKSPRWGLLGEGFLFHEGGGTGVLGRGGALLTDDDKHFPYKAMTVCNTRIELENIVAELFLNIIDKLSCLF